MSSVESLLKYASLAKSVAAYHDIARSVDPAVERLLQSELGAALSNLRQAANSDVEQVSLLRAARDHFNKAVHLESEARLALSFFGLAMCHHALGDLSNAEQAMRSILQEDLYVPSLTWARIVFSLDNGIVRMARSAMIASQTEPLRQHARLYLAEAESMRGGADGA